MTGATAPFQLGRTILVVELTDLVLSFLLAVVTASSGLIQIRLSRIERELAMKPSRQEFDSFRTEMRGDLDSFRTEVRTDMTAQRTDITQIALAVGAGRPQASEG